MITKIQGNEQKVVMTDKATQINGNERKRITKNNQKTIEGTNEEKIVGTSNTTHSANVFINTNAWKRDIIRGSLTLFTGANCNITVGSNNLVGEDALCFDGGGLRQNANTGRLNISTLSNTNIETSANFNLDASAKVDMDSGANTEITAGDHVDVDATSDIEMDTAAKFLVGTNTKPANTVIDSTRIDLNP